MQLGQTPDPSIGFDPYGPTFYDPRPHHGRVTLAAEPQPLRVDPATAAMLAQEFGPATLTPGVVGTPATFAPVESDPKLSLLAVGIGVALVGGALWYFR